MLGLNNPIFYPKVLGEYMYILSRTNSPLKTNPEPKPQIYLSQNSNLSNRNTSQWSRNPSCLLFFFLILLGVICWHMKKQQHKKTSFFPPCFHGKIKEDKNLDLFQPPIMSWLSEKMWINHLLWLYSS